MMFVKCQLLFSGIALYHPPRKEEYKEHKQYHHKIRAEFDNCHSFIWVGVRGILIHY